MEKNNNNTIIVVLLIIGAMYFFGPGAVTDTPDPTNGIVNGVCGIEDIAFTPKMTRLGKAGTSLSTADNNYFILTDSLGTTAANTAKTVPTNYKMQIMFGENSTAYYTVVKTIDSDCADPKYVAVQLALADTSLNSFYAKNADGSVNGAANAQAMGADDEFETTVTIKAGADSYFGNPNSDCDNIAVVQFDKTYVQAVTGDDPVGVPGMFSYNDSSYDGSSAFIIPKTGDGEEVSFNVKIDTTSTEPDGTSSPIVHVYDCDIDKNEDTLELIEGVEDEDLNELSLVQQNLTIVLS